MFIYLYFFPPTYYNFFYLQFNTYKIPHNPLFINYSKKHNTTKSHSPTLPKPTTTPYTKNLTIKNFKIKKSNKNINIKPKQKLKILKNFLSLPQYKYITTKHTILLHQIFTFNIYPYTLYNTLTFTKYKKILFFIFKLN